MGRAVVSPGHLAALVEGLCGLAARHDRRVPVRPHRHLAPFERLVLQVARPVLRKPVLLRQDEPARPDASKVRSQDIAQDDDVAKQFRPAQVLSELRQIVFDERCCLCHRFHHHVVEERKRTFMSRADARLRIWVSLKGGRPVLDGGNRSPYTIVAPPATSSTIPVIQPASSEARKRAARARSSGIPSRRIGCASINICRCVSGMRSLLRSVRIVSGAMQFTRIPKGPTWAARSCVRIWMPAFAAAYGIGDRGWGRRPADEEIVMMLPAFRSFIPGKMLLIVRNVAVRLPSTDACHPSSVVSSSGPGGEWLPPALATMETWYARSGTVRGPTPMMIVNSPTNVPSNANVWVARPIPRLNVGPVQVATHPMSRTPAITLSAVPAARCSYPVTKIPKWANAAPT